MNTSAKFNALFRDVSVGALSALTKSGPVPICLLNRDERSKYDVREYIYPVKLMFYSFLQISLTCLAAQWIRWQTRVPDSPGSRRSEFTSICEMVAGWSSYPIYATRPLH